MIDGSGDWFDLLLTAIPWREFRKCMKVKPARARAPEPGQPLVWSIPIDTRPRDAIGVRAFARREVRIGMVRAHDPTAVAAGPVAAEPRLDSRSR
jgi:hypothetical protein